MCGFEAVEVRALACCRQLRGGASCASHRPILVEVGSKWPVQVKIIILHKRMVAVKTALVAVKTALVAVKIALEAVKIAWRVRHFAVRL